MNIPGVGYEQGGMKEGGVGRGGAGTNEDVRIMTGGECIVFCMDRR